jgi:hypothetical protein
MATEQPITTRLITSRRNFLTRAFGGTVGGAAVTVPIITIASAEERLEHLHGCGRQSNGRAERERLVLPAAAR